MDGQDYTSGHVWVNSETESIVFTVSGTNMESRSDNNVVLCSSGTITVLYTDGETFGTFKILAQSSSPATGDDSNIVLWGSVMGISALGIIVLLISQKRRKATK